VKPRAARRLLVRGALLAAAALLGAEVALRALGVAPLAGAGYPAGFYVADEETGFALAPSFTGTMQSGAERIYGFGRPWEWDGRWLLVVLRVPEDQREVRHLVRTQLAWVGFGSLGNGVWITPHVEREAEAEAMARDASAAELVSFRAELGSLGHPARLIAQAWDLAEVADAYEQFLARFGRLRPKTPESVFRAQTELVHEWRRFPYLDPDLPEEMLPAGWPGSKARRVFEQQHAAWHEPAQEYFRSLDAVQQLPGRRAA